MAVFSTIYQLTIFEISKDLPSLIQLASSLAILIYVILKIVRIFSIVPFGNFSTAVRCHPAPIAHQFRVDGAESISRCLPLLEIDEDISAVLIGDLVLSLLEIEVILEINLIAIFKWYVVQSRCLKLIRLCVWF